MQSYEAGPQYALFVTTAYFGFAILAAVVFVGTWAMRVFAPAAIHPWDMLAGPTITTWYLFAIYLAWDAWKNRNPRARLGITLFHLIGILNHVWQAWDTAGDPVAVPPPVELRPAVIAVQIGAAVLLALWLVALHTPAVDRYLNAPEDEPATRAEG